jgi:predicted MFS family arabinose efflux permease
MSTSTQPAVPARRRRQATRPRHGKSLLTTPLLLGIAYGLYAAFLTSNHGASSTRIMTVSFVGGGAVAVLSFLLGLVQSRLPRELRAAAYGVLFGAAMGYLLSLSGDTWLKAGFVGLFLGISMGIIVFYIRYTHEA